MKVLISGGIKTQNIVNGIASKFENSGVDFIVVHYIEEIEDIFTRGEYFDRAIIIEQSWTNELEETDEMEMRQKLNEFARQEIGREARGVSYVFLTQTAESAAMVYEEILPIKSNSVVVVKAPRYSVSFFTSLVSCDLDQFPEEIVYTPRIEDIQTEDLEEEAGDVILRDIIDSGEEEYQSDNISDILDELLGDDLGEDNELGYDGGVDIGGTFDSDGNIFDGEDTFETDSEELGSMNSEFDEDLYEQGEVYDSVEMESDDLGSGYGTEEFGKQGEFRDHWGDMEGIPIDDEVTIEDSEDEDEESLWGQGTYGDIEEVQIEGENTHEEYVEIQGDVLKNTKQAIRGAVFSDSDYESTEDIYEQPQEVHRVNLSNDKIRATIAAFASRGNSIVVTGCGGCGTSTVAYNLANTIANIGYTVLLVDMDTKGRTQSYISRDNYNSMDTDGANLMAALNSSSGINAHVAIVREGFRLLSMGMGGDPVELDQILQKPRLLRFINLAKNSHNFVIYDIPMKDAVGCAGDVTFMADNLAIVIDSSNWGVAKTMLSICNIESDDMQDTVFSKGQLVYNRYRGFKNMLGTRVRSALDVSKAMDSKVSELVGVDTGFYFSEMHIAGIINHDEEFESGWFNRRQYSDNPEGQKVFLDLLINILLKR